jgi:hypothetical protein
VFQRLFQKALEHGKALIGCRLRMKTRRVLSSISIDPEESVRVGASSSACPCLSICIHLEQRRRKGQFDQ